MQNILAFLAFSASLSSASPFVRNRRQAATSSQLLTDITQIQQYWGQITPYHQNNETFFGVEDVGVPNGCQVEQAHVLERHGARFSTSAFDDGGNDLAFGYKVTNFTANHTSAMFTGPLAFLNTWQPQLDASGHLVAEGAVQSFDAGTRFWAQYGRDLYNATPGQVSYNDSFANGTMRPKLTLRTTSQSRIWNTGINWALGFFGPSFQTTPNPTLMGAMADFNWVVIPEGGTENNTLASYDSCANDNLDPEEFLGDYDLVKYYQMYLKNATARMQQHAPMGFTFTANDVSWTASMHTSANMSRHTQCNQFVPMRPITSTPLISVPYSPRRNGKASKPHSTWSTTTTTPLATPLAELKASATSKNYSPACKMNTLQSQTPPSTAPMIPPPRTSH